MEEFELTDPIVKPEEVTEKFKVISLLLDLQLVKVGTAGPGYVQIRLQSNLGQPFVHEYFGQTATDYIKFINTANFSVNSLHKRILQRLTQEGVLPPGTVTGAPDPPTGT